MIDRLRRRLKTSSLGFRLGSTIAVALIPLGVLSMVQVRNAQLSLEQSMLEGVAGASLAAAQAQIDLIQDAQITARTLAAALSHALDEGASCVARVTSVARQFPDATLVAYIPMSGLMTCSSNGMVHDFSDNPLFQRMIAAPEPSVVYNPMGPVSKTAVVGIGHPVLDVSGRQLGVVSISLPYLAVAPGDFADDAAVWQPTYVAAITRDGMLLISSDPDRDIVKALPADATVEGLAGRIGTAGFVGSGAERKILSVTSVAQDLFLVSLWRQRSTGILDPANGIAPYLLPALTWLAAFVVAVFASSQLVVRHARALSRSMADYLKTHTRVVVPDISGAPAEIQRLHDSYERMVRTIEQEEAELQNLIVDKDRLLHEVNHRSGNSLQIIASVMRMYRREATEPALQAVLDGLINRVIALSSTHTSLYDLAGQRDVPLNDVLFKVIRRLKDIHRVAIGTTDKQLSEIRTDAQTAVGVAMAAAEAVSCFFTHPGLGPGQIVVALSEDAGQVRLRIDGPAVPEFRPEVVQGIASLPRRMLWQFAVQLRGTLAVTVEGDRATVDLRFPNSSAA